MKVMKTEMIVELKGAMVAALMIGLLAFGCGGDAGDDTTDADAGEGDVSGTDGEEAGEVEEAHDDSGDIGEEEEIEETGPPIGDPCASDDDCGEGACLTWLPGGMCSVKGCGLDAPCPEGSRCYSLRPEGLEAVTACLPDCDDVSECRRDEGYVCDEDHTCIEDPGFAYPSLLGAPCRIDIDCTYLGEGSECKPEFMTDGPTGAVNGTCIVSNCANCPADGTCVGTTCWAKCFEDAHCRKGYHCWRDACIPNCEGPEDCPSRYECVAQRCVPGARACGVTNPSGWCQYGQYCIDGQCSGSFSCDSDGLFEPNNAMEEAAELPEGWTGGARLCGGDEDWYRIEAPAGMLTEVAVTFNTEAGDLDFVLYDGDGNFLSARMDDYPYRPTLYLDIETDREGFGLFPPADKEYFLKVTGYESAVNAYALELWRYPWSDGPVCTDLYDEGDCRGNPDEVIRLYPWPQPDADDEFTMNAYRMWTATNYLYARREVIMLVRHAFSVLMAEYPDTGPAYICDNSQIDGWTAGYDIGHPLHCRTCHDEGGNIDISYFQTVGDNMPRTVCGPGGANVASDGLQCTSAASTGHIIDLERQVFFMAALFESPRVRVIFTDPVLNPVINAEAARQNGLGLISDEAYNGFRTKNAPMLSHADHIHLSLQWW